MLTIYANNYISLDGADTGLSVSQESDKTKVFVRENLIRKIGYREINMPTQRYTLSTDLGRATFEADLRKVINA